MGVRIVKNFPSPRLMENIGATNQTIQEAIGELVANSLDARLDNEKVIIKIDIRDDRIVITDNGKGMTSEVLEKAVCIAEDMSKYIERSEGAKGHFGMGFKTSCSTLGKFYEIFTRPIGEDIEYHVEFDIQEYTQRPTGADAWDIEIRDYPPTKNSYFGEASHGTVFVISRLKDTIKYPSAIRQYLEEAFKPDIKQGAEIYLIDDSGTYLAQPTPDSYIKGSKVIIDEVFGPNKKYHITGWMALDKQTNNSGFYGFDIYRKNQLVMQFDKTWFSAHLMTSRIIGEVNMDFLDATFYKQGVQQSSEGWIYSKNHMTEYLKSIVSASRDISRRGNVNSPTEVKRIITKLHQDYGVNDEVHEADYESTDSNFDNEKVQDNEGIQNTIKNVITEEALILENQGEIFITYVVQENGSNIPSPFDYIFSDVGETDDEQKAELLVIVYNNHPLWKKKVDDEARLILATQDSIYRMLVEKLQFETSKALKIRNEWLAKRLVGDDRK